MDLYKEPPPPDPDPVSGVISELNFVFAAIEAAILKFQGAFHLEPWQRPGVSWDCTEDKITLDWGGTVISYTFTELGFPG